MFLTVFIFTLVRNIFDKLVFLCVALRIVAVYFITWLGLELLRVNSSNCCKEILTK